MSIRFIIELDSALHQGSGYGIAGILDRALLRDHTGMPYIPGSAIKGKFREAAIRILSATRSKDEPDPCGVPGKEICKEGPFCAVCTIFGSPMRPGNAIFRDAYPADAEREVLREHLAGGPPSWLPGGTEVRSTTALDRRTGTARKEHLFSTEVLSPLVRFEGEVVGLLDAKAEKLLQHCSMLITTFGGSSSRGLGHGRIVWGVK